MSGPDRRRAGSKPILRPFSDFGYKFPSTRPAAGNVIRPPSTCGGLESPTDVPGKEAGMSTTVEALANELQGKVLGDRGLVVDDVQPLDKAGPQHVAFADNATPLEKLRASGAGAVIVGSARRDSLPHENEGSTFILVDDAQRAGAQALERLRPARPRPEIGISSQAFVSPEASIGPGTNVYPGACIAEGAVIGKNCDIHPHVHIGPGCRLGDEVVLYPGVVLYPDLVLGNRVIVHASSVLGCDGFGYRFEDGAHRKIPHRGTVRIEDDVEIGAGTTVDRGMIGDTVIGEGTKLDDLVMVGHNCKLGKHNIMVSQVGLAGSVTTGDYVICAGQVGIADHVHLGEGCRLGAKSGVHGDIPAGETYIGSPARPEAEARRILMVSGKLPELRRQVRRLEDRIAELEARSADEADSSQHAA